MPARFSMKALIIHVLLARMPLVDTLHMPGTLPEILQLTSQDFVARPGTPASPLSPPCPRLRVSLYPSETPITLLFQYNIYSPPQLLTRTPSLQPMAKPLASTVMSKKIPLPLWIYDSSADVFRPIHRKIHSDVLAQIRDSRSNDLYD